MAFDPNSLVDFLKSKGFGSSFASRRLLWGWYTPRERYAGSPAQNNRLLEALRLGFRAPALQLTGTLYDVGATVEAVVRTDTKVFVLNWFGQQSQEAEPDATLQLGKLNYAGVFPLQIRTGLTVTMGDTVTTGALVAVPDPSGKIRVGLWDTPVVYSAAPVPLPLAAADEALLVKFYTKVVETPNLLNDVGKAVLADYMKADKWFGLGLDVFVGVIITLAPPAGGAMLMYWGPAAVGWFFDALFTFLDKLVEQVPGLTDAERARLKILLAAPVGIAKLGLDIRNFRKGARAVCDGVQLITSIPDTVLIKTFKVESPDEGPKMAGSMLRDIPTKSITLVCGVKR
jgi:hypothetical protein